MKIKIVWHQTCLLLINTYNRSYNYYYDNVMLNVSTHNLTAFQIIQNDKLQTIVFRGYSILNIHKPVEGNYNLI